MWVSPKLKVLPPVTGSVTFTVTIVRSTVTATGGAYPYASSGGVVATTAQTPAGVFDFTVNVALHVTDKIAGATQMRREKHSGPPPRFFEGAGRALIC